MMMIGTHNTMSYLPPKRWWMRPLRVFARCQRKSLAEQIAAGVRVFDLRVYRDNGYWCFAHGLVKFKGATLYTTLDLIPDDSVVRVILERCHDDSIAFRDLCEWLAANHYEIVFSSPQRIVLNARKSVGEQLKAAREAKGYTLRYLAKLTGIANNHISRIEAGRYNATIDTIAVIAAALGAEIKISLADELSQ